MNRSRLVVLTSSGLTLMGAVVALGAYYLDPARAAVGPLPGEALALPAETRMVAGFDVKRFTASPLYRRYADRFTGARPEVFRDFQRKTGLDPERDLDRVIAATTGGGPQDAGLALFQGRFDRYKLSRALESDKASVTWKAHEGTTVYVFGEGRRGAGALAFLDDQTLVLGSASAVEGLLTRRARGEASLRSNQTLITLLTTLKPGAAFWMVGDQSALSSLPRNLPTPGGGPGGGINMNIPLPALKSVTVTADLDPLVALEATGEAADEPAARSLADMVRGLVALASLQAQQKPELRDLASAVSVSTEAARVRINARLPYELFDSFTPKRSVTLP